MISKANSEGCKYCAKKRAYKGETDLWTTNPEFAQFLVNVEDGYNYTQYSNKKLLWKCPDCGYIFEKSPAKIIMSKTFCKICGNTGSYGERFFSNILIQKNINFIKEKSFDWSNKKRYDFFLPNLNLIIEIQGIQHYYYSGFKTTVEKQREIDKIKRELALTNGIQHYIEIKYNGYQYNDYINYKNEIIEHFQFLIDFSGVDWEECHKKALQGMCKNICEKYNQGITNVEELSKIFCCGKTTIRNNLRLGKTLGLCDYEQFAFLNTKTYKEKRDKIIKEQSKAVGQYDVKTNLLIHSYPSIQQAQRDTGIRHIWDCCVGKRNIAGGYKWKYIKSEDK